MRLVADLENFTSLAKVMHHLMECSQHFHPSAPVTAWSTTLDMTEVRRSFSMLTQAELQQSTRSYDHVEDTVLAVDEVDDIDDTHIDIDASMIEQDGHSSEDGDVWLDIAALYSRMRKKGLFDPISPEDRRKCLEFNNKIMAESSSSRSKSHQDTIKAMAQWPPALCPGYYDETNTVVPCPHATEMTIHTARNMTRSLSF